MDLYENQHTYTFLVSLHYQRRDFRNIEKKKLWSVISVKNGDVIIFVILRTRFFTNYYKFSKIALSY